MQAQYNANPADSEALFAMLRPELFQAEFAALGLLGAGCSLLAAGLVMLRRKQVAQSWLILVSLVTVLICTAVMKLNGEKLAVIYGCFAAYLLTSVWLERQSWGEHKGSTERFLFSVPLAVAFAVIAYLIGSSGYTITQSIYPLVLLLMATMAVVGDANRVMASSESSQLSSDRLKWRLCFAVHILVASAVSMLGAALTLAPLMQLAVLLPELGLLAISVYFLLRSYTNPLPDLLAAKPIVGPTFRA